MQTFGDPTRQSNPWSQTSNSKSIERLHRCKSRCHLDDESTGMPGIAYDPKFGFRMLQMKLWNEVKHDGGREIQANCEISRELLWEKLML